MRFSRFNIDPKRRRFLLSGGGIAVGAVAGLAGIAPAGAQSTAPKCASDASADAFHSAFGSLRLSLIGSTAPQSAVPVTVSAPGSRALIDLSGRTPLVRIGPEGSAILLEPKGVRLQGERRSRRWSPSAVKALTDQLASSAEHLTDLFSLRQAVFALYPEYLAHTGRTAPKALAQQQTRSGRRIASFGRSPRTEACHLETIVEETTRTVRTTVDVVLTAAERYAQCSERCDQRFLAPGRERPIDFAICETECVAAGFVDLFVGTVELVETVVETVSRQVLICAEPIRDVFRDPFRGRVPVDGYSGLLAGATGPAADFPADVQAKATDVLVKMVKSLPKALQCVATGTWSITALQTVGVNVAGLGSVPLGITVCMDRECALTLIGAGLGKEAFSIVASLISLAESGSIAAAVAAAGITGAAAVAVSQLVLCLLAVLIVLMVHLMIVAGQIVAYESLGMIAQGICITHPSLPVIAAGVLNPLLGLLALGNMPLVVTPRG